MSRARRAPLTSLQIAQLLRDQREWIRVALSVRGTEVQCGRILDLFYNIMEKRRDALPLDLFTGNPAPTPEEIIRRLEHIAGGGN